MVPEIAAEIGGSALATASTTQAASLPASYNFSLADVARFENAYNGVSGVESTSASAALKPSSFLDSPAMKAVMDPLNRVNQDAMKLAEDTGLMAGDGELSPGQMIMLTVRCQEFLFHCEMTSNVANRTSDGFQQLFRQQS
jgi:hypothetical protein